MVDSTRRSASRARGPAWPYIGAMLTMFGLIGIGGGLASGSETDDLDASVNSRPEQTTSTAVTTTRATTTTEPPPSLVEVPSLDLVSESEARQTLRSLGLVGRVERQEVGALEFAFVVGHVFEQDPAPGTLVEEGAEVIIRSGTRPSPTTQRRDGSLPDGDWIDTSEVSAAGRCADLVADPPGMRLRRVDCDEPHDLESIGTVLIEAPGEYDLPTIDRFLETACQEKLDEYVGLADGRLGTFTVRPAERWWAEGDRIGYCYAAAQSWTVFQLVGTAKDSMW